MVAVKTRHRCIECGHEQVKWFGLCPRCGESATAEEISTETAAGRGTSAPPAQFAPLSGVSVSAAAHQPTGIDELDRVLGGGIVAGSYIILGAEPGAGKSTLASQLLVSWARAGRSVALVCAEESPAQVHLRFQRLGGTEYLDRIAVSAETNIDAVIAGVRAGGYDLVVVDSIQTVHVAGGTGVPGSPTQVRECGQRLMELAKREGIAVVVIGQVTKDGSLAGPRTLEHMVDVVLAMEGDAEGMFRVLHASKNRFGSTDEIGVFTMGAHGLEGVPDPSATLLTQRPAAAPGAAVCPVIEGTRPLLVEVQALVNPSTLPQPIRAARGIDARRFQLLMAVLSRRARLRLGSHDIYLQVAGGLKVEDPALDLAVCAAVASSYADTPIDETMVLAGEVTLLGEVRPVPQQERRAAEAARLGRGTMIGAPQQATLSEALSAAGVTIV